MGLIRGGGDKNSSMEVLPVNSTNTIKRSSTYAVDTSAAPVTLTVEEGAGIKSFAVFDSAGNFDAQPCYVVIGADTYVLDKKNKQYDFYYDGSSWRWSEINKVVN
tara:strand:- start:5170 stop:5484 length:315 start_codon:yes stop_codon:yes gene_type:complete